jgi:hypothetical protein
MSAAGLFMLLAISVAVIAFIIWPLVFAAPESRPVSTVQSLQNEREAVLDALQALDFDYQTGKLLEEDYRVQRAALVARGTDILRQIDELPTNRKTKR